jgi:hypothetical protein
VLLPFLQKKKSLLIFTCKSKKPLSLQRRHAKAERQGPAGIHRRGGIDDADPRDRRPSRAIHGDRGCGRDRHDDSRGCGATGRRNRGDFRPRRQAGQLTAKVTSFNAGLSAACPSFRKKESSFFEKETQEDFCFLAAASSDGSGQQPSDTHGLAHIFRQYYPMNHESFLLLMAERISLATGVEKLLVER